MSETQEYPERRRWDGDYSALAYPFDESIEPVDPVRLIYEYHKPLFDEPVVTEVIGEFEEFASHNSWLDLTERSPFGNRWVVKPNAEVCLDPHYEERQMIPVGRCKRVIPYQEGTLTNIERDQ